MTRRNEALKSRNSEFKNILGGMIFLLINFRSHESRYHPYHVILTSMALREGRCIAGCLTARMLDLKFYVPLHHTSGKFL